MKSRSHLFVIIISFFSLISCSTKEHGDLLISGGTIYTMEEASPQAEAVVVKDGKILFAGALTEAKKYTDDKTKHLDLKGKTLTPGFIESHGHIMDVGYNEMSLNLTDADSFEEIIKRVQAQVSKSKPGDWIIGRGWHQDKWSHQPNEMVQGFPVHRALSEVSPDNPVFLEHASGHAALANKKALEAAGIQPLAKERIAIPSVDGGEVLVDSNGMPTGLLNENALTLVSDKIPSRNDTLALQLALKACLKNGITSFHDAGATRSSIELFKHFKQQGTLLPGLYVMITGFDRALVHEYFARGPEIDPEGVLTIRSVKLNCDGALGSRGAWLLEPYADQHTVGLPTLPMDTVLATSRAALKAGFQVCSHAIGDRANREILDRYELAFNEANAQHKDHRFRIEHAQHMHPDDIPRFGKLGVIPAMQAIHMSSDRPWAIQRLGEKRIKEGAYMWQSLLRSGARIANGTDAPVEPLNPIACFYASITRKTLSGTPEDGYEPEEKMTREQALRSYTLDAAYAGFEETIKGSIAKGKRADFTVLSQDIMTVDENDLLKTEIEMTIVGGNVLYEKK